MQCALQLTGQLGGGAFIFVRGGGERAHRDLRRRRGVVRGVHLRHNPIEGVNSVSIGVLQIQYGFQ